MNVADIVSKLEDLQGDDTDNRESSREAETFCEKKNGQWEERIWKKFSNKPRYTFDKVNHIVDLVCSSIESRTFSINLSPADIQTSQEMADIASGIIRNMQYQDKTDEIYNMAMRKCIKTGFDAWRVNTAWIDGGFTQKPTVEYIPNAIDRVWFDCDSVKPDASDAKYCYVMAEMTKKEFERRWPKATLAPLSSDRRVSEYWHKPEKIMVGEYLYAKEEDLKLCLLANNEVVTSDSPSYEQMKLMYGVKRERTQKQKRWYSRKFTAFDWLDDKPVATVFKSCPVVPVYGNFGVSDGKVIYRGMVERLMDAQRVLNYAKSREIEEGALQARRMWWMTPKMAGDEKNIARLKEMNTSSNPVQFFEPDERMPGAMPFQAGTNEINPHLSNLSATMQQDIEASAGKYGVSLGKNTGLQSGVALELQNDQASLGDIKWQAVLARCIRRTADIIVEVMPTLMDTYQEVQILTEGMKQSIEAINKPVSDGNRQVIQNDMSKAKFSVVVNITESHNTKQKEAVAALLEVAAVKPDILDVGADILLSSMNAPGIKEVAERYRTQMVNAGRIPPKQMTEEEQQLVAQAAQTPPPPDPNLLLAQAEMLKAQADMIAQQNKQQQIQIEMKKMEQSGYKVLVDEQKAIAEVANKNADTIKKAAEAEKISGETTKQRLETIDSLMDFGSPQQQINE